MVLRSTRGQAHKVHKRWGAYGDQILSVSVKNGMMKDQLTYTGGDMKIYLKVFG